MSRNYSSSSFLRIPWYLWLLIFIIILLLLFFWPGRRKHPTAWVTTDQKDGKISWNILFKPGTDKDTRDKYIKYITDYIKTAYLDYNRENKTNYKPASDTVFFCPCDTLLYNFDFRSLDGEGKSITTAPPPPPPPGLGGSGNYISQNLPVGEPFKNPRLSTAGYDSNVVKNIGTDPSKILAIIDAGIDSTLFNTAISNLIWKDPAFPTLYNFLPGRQVSDRFDETAEKHGSAVAAITIKAMENTSQYPKIMILKALDSANKGSIFSVSCALSYAIQKKASVINLSLGYYGAPDSILHHYLGLTATATPSIHVFAAAGNTRGSHSDSSLCNPQFNDNLLSDTLLFYPACFSQEFKDLTSVTQIRQKDSACYYQNYSDQFVNLGVYDSLYCCATPVRFTGNSIRYYEGSSFVTPMAAGLKMGTLLMGTSRADADSRWDALVSTDPHPNKVVKGGKYITYFQR